MTPSFETIETSGKYKVLKFSLIPLGKINMLEAIHKKASYNFKVTYFF